MTSTAFTTGRPFRVALRRVGSTDDAAYTALAGCFDLLEADQRLSERAGRLVVIKPNVTAPRPSGSGVVTDVRVVEAFVRLLREREPRVERIVVADGPGMADALKCFAVAGYE